MTALFLESIHSIMNCKQLAGILASSFVAGVAISCGGFVFLAKGGVAGAVLFTFGLLTVVHYKLKLYTGFVGFMDIRSESAQSLLILAGNILGCLAMAMMARVSSLPLQETAAGILEARLKTGPLQCGALAIGCGFIVTTAVHFGRKEQWLPLLFGVPCFIVCGFPHCIADAFYYLTVPFELFKGRLPQILALYACIVAGNFIGCNLYRFIIRPKE